MRNQKCGLFRRIMRDPWVTGSIEDGFEIDVVYHNEKKTHWVSVYMVCVERRFSLRKFPLEDI